MCGINGLLHFPDGGRLESTIRAMGQTLKHRGPDGSGIWLEDKHGLALGHQRLAIVDLSPAGQQPMHSADNRYVMVFNGEIYNHPELRKKLDSQRQTTQQTTPQIAWRGHSDTETLLAAFSQWGIEATLEQCVGMFAIALWDKQLKQLTLIRDRVGEKPLYYGYIDSCFAFASELKAFNAIHNFKAIINRSALNRYMHYGYVPAPDTIYQGIAKLTPGALLTFDSASHSGIRSPDIKQWWSFSNVTQQGQNQLIHNRYEALERLEAQLTQSIKLQARADVPVGAFLSGGIDSSTVVSLLQNNTCQTVKTFTVGFEQAGYNEAEHAKSVAKYLETEHTELYVGSKAAREVIPLLPTVYDEPFADTSQIPTYLICQHARKSVTVALSGDGGDELFGGYSSYIHSRKIWGKLQGLPAPLRKTLSRALAGINPKQWDQLATWLGKSNLSGNNLHKLGNSLSGSHDLQSFFTQLTFRDGLSHSLVLGDVASQPLNLHSPFQPEQLPDALWNSLDAEHAMMLTDSLGGLPDDILCKTDRAAMAVGLETRIPFLDHRVIGLAWRIPLTLKINHSQHIQGKSILRELLYQHVPQSLVERPKQGFNVPIESWLRGELREWAEDLLNESSLRQAGYLDAGQVRTQWADFLSGKRANQQQIWTILMFQAWLKYWHS